MKKYNEFILLEAKKNSKLTNQWFDAIENNNIEEIKYLINQGIDVNIRWIEEGHRISIGDTALMLCACHGAQKLSKDNQYTNIGKILLNHPKIDVNLKNEHGYNALFYAFYNKNKIITKLLLQRPEIDVDFTIRNTGHDFFLYTFINKSRVSFSYLIDYTLQKKILNNKRIDILLLLYKYNLIEPKIKEEYPAFFTGVDLNLL